MSVDKLQPCQSGKFQQDKFIFSRIIYTERITMYAVVKKTGKMSCELDMVTSERKVGGSF